MGVVVDKKDFTWISNAIARYCDQCKKRTPQEYTVADIQLIHKGRMTSFFWKFLSVITLTISDIFTGPFEIKPKYRYLYTDTCTKCGIKTKVENVTSENYCPRYHSIDNSLTIERID